MSAETDTPACMAALEEFERAASVFGETRMNGCCCSWNLIPVGLHRSVEASAAQRADDAGRTRIVP
jgi:hypothetical protein